MEFLIDGDGNLLKAGVVGDRQERLGLRRNARSPREGARELPMRSRAEFDQEETMMSFGPSLGWPDHRSGPRVSTSPSPRRVEPLAVAARVRVVSLRLGDARGEGIECGRHSVLIFCRSVATKCGPVLRQPVALVQAAKGSSAMFALATESCSALT